MSAGNFDALREADTRARAIVRTEFDGAIVLEAGAGTGKTTTLVARITAWLVDRGFDESMRALGAGAARAAIASRALDGVLAITFTEAAAADMDKKIRAALATVENGSLPQGMQGHVYAHGDAEIRLRAADLRRALERPLARTIHAFCKAVLSDFALDAGLHPSFEVDVDGRRVRAIARDEIVRDLRETLTLDTGLDWHVLAARGIGPADVENALVELTLAGTRAQDLAHDSFPPDVVRTIDLELVAAITSFVRECALPLAQHSSGASKFLTVCDEASVLAAEIATPARNAVELAAHTRFARKTISEYTRTSLAAWANGEAPKSVAKKDPDFAALLVVHSRVLERLLVRYVRLDSELHGAARRLFARLLDRTRAGARRRGVETFGDLLRDARDLIVDDSAVRSRLRAGLTQVLVDEFQDTDPIQCDIVDALALRDASGTAPGLLIVGDPKQSIYGFRNADLRAYEDFVAKVVRADGRTLRLSLNFRSQQALLDRVTEVMTRVMHEEAGVQPRFEPLVAERVDQSSVLEHWDSKAVRDGKSTTAMDARVEAEFLARELAAANARGTAWHEMGVLMRKRTSLETILEALRARSIPFDVIGDRSYYKRREVVDAAALVTCVVDPSDLLALVAYLRSSTVGVPDALWIPLSLPGPEGSFFDLAGALDARDPASIERVRAVVNRALARMPADVPGLERIVGFERALHHALDSIALLRQSFATEPSDIWLERLRSLTSAEATAAARYQGRYRVANLQRFFGEVERELVQNGGDATALLRTLRGAVTESLDAAEAKPRGVERSAVQIQTMHQSKGLDYEHVYLVGLHQRAGAGSFGRKTTRVDEDAQLLFDAPNLAWFEAEERDAKREAAEMVRLLYVAMTRAKNKLVLSGSLPTSTDPEAATHEHMLGSISRSISDAVSKLREAAGSDDFVCGGVRYRLASGTIEAQKIEPARVDSVALASRAAHDSERLRVLTASAEMRNRRALVAPMSALRLRDEEWNDHVAKSAARLPALPPSLERRYTRRSRVGGSRATSRPKCSACRSPSETSPNERRTRPESTNQRCVAKHVNARR